jgi:hypothetical protein
LVVEAVCRRPARAALDRARTSYGPFIVKSVISPYRAIVKLPAWSLDRRHIGSELFHSCLDRIVMHLGSFRFL